MHLHQLIASRRPSGTFCDPFGGIGTVGSSFKAKGYEVWTGDILAFAHCFQVARVQCSHAPRFLRLCKALNLKCTAQIVEHLNTIHPERSWFVREYSETRRFFTPENAARIEACRLQINKWSRHGWISEQEEAVLLASLINSMDKVANTAGTYYAFLKHWYRKARKPFRFDLIPVTRGACGHSVLCEAKSLVSAREFDTLYLDPPYNERDYASYYHLPETIALKQAPHPHGKAGVPAAARPHSPFNRPNMARSALVDLLKNARFKTLAFHYSDQGLISPKDIRAILTNYGRLEVFRLRSKGYSTVAFPRNVNHRLYLVTHG